MTQIQMLREKLEGDILPLTMHRSRILADDELRRVAGGLDESCDTEKTPSCSQGCPDDCQD